VKNLLALKIIKLCLKREFYQRYSKKISKESLANINDIYKTIGRIYDELESCKEILPDDLHIHHLTYNPTLTEYKKENTIGDSVVEVTKDLDELLQEMDYSKLFSFNSPSALNSYVKGVGKGHFTIIFARPESGKTTFWINMVAGDNGFAHQEKVNNIAIFCNEEQPTRNVFRMIQACANMTRDEVDKEPSRANDCWKLIKDKVHVYDCKDFTLSGIDEYCEEYQPQIIVIDQLDKVEIHGSYNSSHEKLREIYKCTRDIASRRDVCVFGICQASSDAHDRNHISFNTMEGSKTGKAAEADLIIGIGKKDDWENDEDFTRSLCISKNKLTGWHGVINCKIQPTKSRYID
jgi:KaiC/GvpD/RAD55 family RecA-like ATPase